MVSPLLLVNEGAVGVLEMVMMALFEEITEPQALTPEQVYVPAALAE
jgi:hypothetical protein